MFLFDREVKTYTIKAPNGLEVIFDSKTNLIMPNGKYPNEKYPDLVKAPEIKARMILDARKEMDSSPYKNYKPLLYKKDSIVNGFMGAKTSNLYMLEWKKIYLQESVKGKEIAPWTNSEKAYYQSLNGRERYNYLVARSGIESSIIVYKHIALREIDRPKEQIYLQTYDKAKKEYEALLLSIEKEDFYFKSDDEIDQIYKTRYAKFESVIQKLEFVYTKSRDYKAGLLLAEVYMNDAYYVAKVLSATKRASRRGHPESLCPALRAIKPFIQAKTKRSVNILLELIEAYSLPDAYYGMYRYCVIQKQSGSVVKVYYNAPNTIKTPEYWFELALQYGSYDAFRALSNDWDRELLNAEYCLSLGILGNRDGFIWAELGLNRWGFATRASQAHILALQLGYENELRLGKQYMKLLKKIPKDEYGLRPFLTEYIDILFSEELNRTNYEGDPSFLRLEFLNEKIKSGELLSPTDPKATKESRETYRKIAMSWHKNPYDAIGFKEEWEDYQVERHAKRVVLRAKILALTPPQGYPNAPFYYFPEEIEERFEKGELDFKLNPTIPAIYRESFPQELRDKIQSYAKKHNIKN
ncbi:hypothetical protein [Helicobacter trogontum]|uniref:hypothetical protein n=1 Tax=Helicobacter trogontum TaxID=50960 RepID=UPI000CF18C36|nr:hypothetical protein [Helicobacter trogontum]